jgi:hypothetical protein
MATYVKVAGTWKEVTSDSPSNGVCGYVKVNGTWRTVNQSYVRINGVWRATCTAPGQQPPPIPETICYRPNYCLNGTNGVILPTTEPCYLADGVTLGTRTAPYTCQTDPGCITYTVPAGTCTTPDPIITVVSEEIGDCEFWGGLSGCTSGYAKRIARRMSDASLKISYSCCNPLEPNLKYYCTLRPFSTGQCLNELKDTDFTGTVVPNQGEWVCEALGVTSFPSCSTSENCTVPKSTSPTYEGCGYLSTGQRLVTTNIYQSWCDPVQETIIGECVGADDPCGGKYCGEGSGEEEYAASNCSSGNGIRYKCVTPDGCQTRYTFKRCVAPPPPCGGGTVFQITSVTYTNTSKTNVASCNQYSSCTVPNSTGATNEILASSTGQYVPCPSDAPIVVDGIINQPGVNCSTCFSYDQEFCTTSDGRPGYQQICVTAAECDNIPVGGCVAPATGCGDCSSRDEYPCDCPNGGTGVETVCVTPGDCPPIISPCNCTGVIGPGESPNCSACVFGSGVVPCDDAGGAGSQTYCITDVGCADIYGPCINGNEGITTPEQPPVTNATGPVPTGPVTQDPPFTDSNGDTFYWETQQTTDGGTINNLIDAGTGEPVGPPLILPDLSFVAGAGGESIKSININTLVRTRDGLVAAHDLKVGDKLLSADIATFPYDNLLATNMELIEWTAQNPHINLVETEIVGLRTRTSQWAIIVDSDIFSDTHYILVNRNNVTKFVKAIDLERTDLIWSNTYHNWVSISVLKKVDVDHEVVSIDCEPYDIFFTERMLTHDSNTVD